MFNIKYFKQCTVVYDCYKLSNKKINNISKEIVKQRKERKLLLTRTEKSYACEIKAHKRAYLLGIKRDHSKDADLEENMCKSKEILYKIFGV